MNSSAHIYNLLTKRISKVPSTVPSIPNTEKESVQSMVRRRILNLDRSCMKSVEQEKSEVRETKNKWNSKTIPPITEFVGRRASKEKRFSKIKKREIAAQKRKLQHENDFQKLLDTKKKQVERRASQSLKELHQAKKREADALLHYAAYQKRKKAAAQITEPGVNHSPCESSLGDVESTCSTPVGDASSIENIEEIHQSMKEGNDVSIENDAYATLFDMVDGFPANSEGASALRFLCSQEDNVKSLLLGQKTLHWTHAGDIVLEAFKQHDEPILPTTMQEAYQNCSGASNCQPSTADVRTSTFANADAAVDAMDGAVRHRNQVLEQQISQSLMDDLAHIEQTLDGISNDASVNFASLSQDPGNSFIPVVEDLSQSFIPVVEDPSQSFIPVVEDPSQSFIPVVENPSQSFIPVVENPNQSFIPIAENHSHPFIPAVERLSQSHIPDLGAPSQSFIPITNNLSESTHSSIPQMLPILQPDWPVRSHSPDHWDSVLPESLQTLLNSSTLVNNEDLTLNSKDYSEDKNDTQLSSMLLENCNNSEHSSTIHVTFNQDGNLNNLDSNIGVNYHNNFPLIHSPSGLSVSNIIANHSSNQSNLISLSNFHDRNEDFLFSANDISDELNNGNISPMDCSPSSSSISKESSYLTSNVDAAFHPSHSSSSLTHKLDSQSFNPTVKLGMSSQCFGSEKSESQPQQHAAFHCSSLENILHLQRVENSRDCRTPCIECEPCDYAEPCQSNQLTQEEFEAINGDGSGPIMMQVVP